MSGLALLRFTCSAGDVEPLVAALRAITAAPIHVHDEAVRGLDFADAGTAERVAGELRRAAIELVVPADMIAEVESAACNARRRLPVRWIALPVLGQGRSA